MVGEPEIARLYALPLEEFTPARNALARELRKGGDKAKAEEVARLRKPSVSAWAINQVARAAPETTQALLDAGRALGAAQARLLAGDDRGEALREATEEERMTVSGVVREAEKALRGAGHAATETTLKRIATTLRAAARDEAARGLLEAGRLVEDLDPSGFGSVGEVSLPVAPPRRAREGKGERADAEAVERARHELRRARERLKAARAELRAKEREADATEEARERARRAAAEAEKSAAEKRASASEAAAAVERAESAVEAATEAVGGTRARRAPGG